jgi:hypothetical protein
MFYWRTSRSALLPSSGEITHKNNDCILHCCTMCSGKSLPTFRKCLLPQSSWRWVTSRDKLLLIAMMMAAGSTSETSVNFYQITWWKNPEDSHLHTCCFVRTSKHQFSLRISKRYSWRIRYYHYVIYCPRFRMTLDTKLGLENNLTNNICCDKLCYADTMVTRLVNCLDTSMNTSETHDSFKTCTQT